MPTSITKFTVHVELCHAATIFLQIVHRWDDLRRALLGLDPESTGCVSESEFTEVVIDLCPQLTEHDLQQIITRVTVPGCG